MSTKDPANKKYRTVIYIIYALLLSWIIICFGIGAAMGVFSSAGKDKLAAREVALIVCSAASSSDPTILIDSCPPGVDTGSPTVLLKKAREAAATISDAETRGKAADLLNSFEVIASGKLNLSNVPRLLEGPIKDYLN